jgi:flagellar basal body rod protein FlgF
MNARWFRRPSDAAGTACTLLLLALPLLAAANPATVVRQSTLHARPFADAPPLATLAAKSRVDIVAAQGAWNQVRTADGKTGWVRLLNLRPEAGKGGSTVAGLAQMGNVARTGSTGAAATTGAKGISREDLEAAEPNAAEVERLERFRATPAEARQYAAMARLTAREVAPLPARSK